MSTTPGPEAKPAITFTDKEEHVLKVAWTCLKSGPPDVDMVKLTKAAGFNTTKTAANTWGVIKKKLGQMNPPQITPGGDSGESATPATLKTPKTKGSPKKRGKNISSDGDEGETGYDVSESPKKKQRKSPTKKPPNKVVNGAVADDDVAEEEADGGAAV